MTTWLNGFYGGIYTVSTATWVGYFNFTGQFDGDNVYFNESVALTISPGAAITSFTCTGTHSFGPTGTGPPCTGRIRAIKNSTSLVTNSTTAALALSQLTTAFVDITIPNSTGMALNLTAIAQEVVSESHWASGNKITFVVQGTGGAGMKSVFPTWSDSSFGVGGGGGGGQSGVNGSFLIGMLLEEDLL